MIKVSLFAGELIFVAVWMICRAFIWLKQKRIDWKREALLLLMFVNLAVIIRFVFYPLFRVDGHVAPLIIDFESSLPPRINLVPFVNITDYEAKREALINIIGNTAMFIPTGVILPIIYKRLDRFWKVVLAGASISLCIEVMQLLFPNSVTDIDDLILNTLGVAVGYGIYSLTRIVLRKLKGGSAHV